MSKNKGLVIELTSLLDVILIMLFWVMMVSGDKAEKAEADADQKLAEAKSIAAEAEAYKEQYRKDIELGEDMSAALNNFENGEMLSISITVTSSSNMLSFSRSEETLSSVVLSNYSDVEAEIRHVLDSLPDKNGIILAAFIYDGSVALHRDVEAVKRALENLKQDYPGIYFAYVNTSA